MRASWNPWVLRAIIENEGWAITVWEKVNYLMEKRANGISIFPLMEAGFSCSILNQVYFLVGVGKK